MKISISDNNNERTVQVDTGCDGLDILGVARELRGLLIAYGFHENSVDEHIFIEDNLNHYK